MAPKGDAHRSYAIHGDGLDSLRRGLIEIQMPDHRRDEALAHTLEVVGKRAGLERSRG